MCTAAAGAPCPSVLLFGPPRGRLSRALRQTPRLLVSHPPPPGPPAPLPHPRGRRDVRIRVHVRGHDLPGHRPNSVLEVRSPDGPGPLRRPVPLAPSRGHGRQPHESAGVLQGQHRRVVCPPQRPGPPTPSSDVGGGGACARPPRCVPLQPLGAGLAQSERLSAAVPMGRADGTPAIPLTPPPPPTPRPMPPPPPPPPTQPRVQWPGERTAAVV